MFPSKCETLVPSKMSTLIKSKSSKIKYILLLIDEIKLEKILLIDSSNEETILISIITPPMQVINLW